MAGLRNHQEFLIDCALSVTGRPDPRILDYGCGAGEVVCDLVEKGLDAYGVDVFYGGAADLATVECTGLLGTRILHIPEGETTFPDDHFDVVMCDQVFEHIASFDETLREITRILKPDGVFINVFPTAEVWREGHTGVPFIHRFNRTSPARLPYTRVLRTCGLGYFKDSRTSETWARDNLDWIDRWVHYKPYRLVRQLFERSFSVGHLDADYMRFRIRRNRWTAPLVPLADKPAFAPLLTWGCGRLGGHVFVLRPIQTARTSEPLETT